jgi:protein-disulfide isomerase
MRHRVMAWVLAASAGLLLAPAGEAQTPEELQALSKDVEALKAGQAAMQKELEEIKGLLRAARAAPAAPARPPGPEKSTAVLSLAGGFVKGEETAKVTLLEFTDYQCPFCGRYFRQTWPELDKEYVQTGKVRYVVRDMPLEQIHPLALQAAEAADCAGEQGKFWAMHDRLFANQTALTRKDLTAHAEAVGLDAKAFAKCVDSAKNAVKVRTDAIDATRAGARGTPTFYVGLTEPQRLELKAAWVIRGAQPYAVFKQAIDALLASAQQ